MTLCAITIRFDRGTRDNGAPVVAPHGNCKP